MTKKSSGAGKLQVTKSQPSDSIQRLIRDSVGAVATIGLVGRAKAGGPALGGSLGNMAQVRRWQT